MFAFYIFCIYIMHNLETYSKNLQSVKFKFAAVGATPFALHLSPLNQASSTAAGGEPAEIKVSWARQAYRVCRRHSTSPKFGHEHGVDYSVQTYHCNNTYPYSRRSADGVQGNHGAGASEDEVIRCQCQTIEPFRPGRHRYCRLHIRRLRVVGYEQKCAYSCRAHMSGISTVYHSSYAQFTQLPESE